MLEPPKLAKTTLIAALQTHYGLAVDSLSFLPLGHDSATWVYRLATNEGQTYFLKARASGGFGESSLEIPYYLRQQGVPHIVAPRPTIAQTLWINLNDFALSLYPYIEGQSGADAGLSPLQWRTFGRLAKRIHSCQLPVELLQILPRENFVPSRRELIPDLEKAIAEQAFPNDMAGELATFWLANHDTIRLLVDRADALGRQLRNSSAPGVLCHADMHTWNVLLDREQQLWLIDWDETVLARKERDLMFVVGGIGGDGVGPQETATFLQGYGEVSIDSETLAYYRYAWAVQDMAANAEQIFFSPDLGEDTRRAALQSFKSLFAPGNIVSLALG